METIMQIMIINQALVDRGSTAFHLATLQFMCGPNASVYSAAKRRRGGLSVVPGAIVAAIEMGFTTRAELITAVARATRCWESTIASVLEGLSGNDVPDRLWASNPDGTYGLTGRLVAKPFSVLTS